MDAAACGCGIVGPPPCRGRPFPTPFPLHALYWNEMTNDIQDGIRAFFKGEIKDDADTLAKFSRDASLFEVRPTLVLSPKDTDDLKQLVRFVSKEKSSHPELSLTGRSAGTDMGGGPLTESVVLDFISHFNHFSIDEAALTATVEPGVYYHDFEKETGPKHISYPSYPASKAIAAFGGIVMNNAGGEKALRYGQTRDYVLEVKMILSDGNEYVFRKLSRAELEAKMKQQDFEGELYRKMYKLVTENHDEIEKARPHTSKNSAGYALWRIWDKQADTFDLAQLFVGSQGTLGLFAEAKLQLVKDTPHRKLVALFMRSWDDLPAVVNAVLPLKPESMETFDDNTLKLGLRFMPEIAKKAHENLLRFAARFLPEAWIGVEMLGLPKLIVLAEFAEDTKEELDSKCIAAVQALKKFPAYARILEDGPESEKYWIMRRESFNLLRQHVAGKQTAPFIDDFAVLPEKMPEFLPKLLKVLKDAGIAANIAGHAGDGNYHIIPLMDLTKESERAKIVPAAEKIYSLIGEYGGTITAEHNDGIIRTPFLPKMFSPRTLELFAEAKSILDPQGIFNPGKKIGGTLEYLQAHIKAK